CDGHAVDNCSGGAHSEGRAGGGPIWILARVLIRGPVLVFAKAKTARTDSRCFDCAASDNAVPLLRRRSARRWWRRRKSWDAAWKLQRQIDRCFWCSCAQHLG